jgi:anaerobic magnesium-protoporphyrin IX monomethyl ester cyclase
MKRKVLQILLVKPFQLTNEVQPPLGLGYMASTVRDVHDVTILDCIKEGMRISGFSAFLSRRKFDVIGFQCYTVDLNTVKEFSHAARQAQPGAVLLVGGPQATLDPEGTMDFLRDIDYAFAGEGETGFPVLMELLSQGGDVKQGLSKVPGLVYRSGKKYVQNERVFACDLDRFDPSWDLYGMESYPVAPHGSFYKQTPVAPIIITRGCPYQCTYCGGPLISGRRIRSHSVDYVIEQVKTLHLKYGVREIFIEDDNFTMKREFVEDFCRKLIELDMGITWTCPNGIRLDTLDMKLLRLMKRSGLYSVSVGIESGSDRIRKLMKKNLDTKTIVEKVNLIHEAGLGVIGFFIVGFPGETKKDIEATIKFACDLPLKRATFSAFKPFPGTEIYRQLVSEGRIKEMKWENFSLDKVAWSPEGISEKELKSLRRKAFIKFYMRPKIIMQMLSEIRSLENLRFIVVRMYRWLS